jgi:transketolase
MANQVEINKKQLKRWSVIGPRATFGLAMQDLGSYLDNLIVISADVSTSAGLDRYRKTFPDKYIEAGIAEQNMMGIAAGLADNGFQVVTTSFAPFQVLRCLEQIKVNFAYARLPGVFVGLASGLINGPLGNTHCCIEDMGVLRSIPNMIVVSPADGLSVVKALHAAMNCDVPIYLRLTGGANLPIVYDHDFKFEIGQAVRLRSGKDVVILAAGTMVAHALQVANSMGQKGMSVGVWDFHTVKPIDKAALWSIALTYDAIVTLEEHSVIGGLGSAVAEELSGFKEQSRLLRLGIDDTFLKPGDYNFMLEQAGLSVDVIEARVTEFLSDGVSAYA